MERRQNIVSSTNPKVNPWYKNVANYAKENNITYEQALADPTPGYSDEVYAKRLLDVERRKQAAYFEGRKV